MNELYKIAQNLDRLAKARENGYENVHVLPNGACCAVQALLFTYSLIVGVDREHGPLTRYCYETMTEAVDAILTWSGEGDPPGNWIVQKPEQRIGPGAR